VSVNIAAQCFIATATFGSEMAPEVQVLRNFRDNQIMRTQAGSAFMVAFNAWYYSFSPNVANTIAGGSALKAAFRAILYPLIIELNVGARVFTALSANPEIAAILTGLTVSSLIGATYLGLPLAGVARFSRTVRRTVERLLRPLALATAIALIVTLAAEILSLGVITVATSASVAVLGTLAVTGLGTSRLLLRLTKTSG